MPNLDLSIAKIMQGDTPVLRIMEGDTRVWPSGTDVAIDGVLTNITSSVSIPGTAALNSSLTITLTPNSSHVINQISVTMGGEDITATAYNEGVITIASVTGDIIIHASAIEVITFEDAAVKTICVTNWGGNVIEGEITPAEAASVTSVLGYFSNNSEIKKFNEFVYFTSAGGSWENIFVSCTSLEEVTAPPVTVTNFAYAFRYCNNLKFCDLSRITSAWSNNNRAFESAAYSQSAMELRLSEFYYRSEINFSYCGSKLVPIDVTQGWISVKYKAPTSANSFRRFRRLLVKDIGYTTATHEFSGCRSWGVNTTDNPDNIDLMKASLLQYSKDRAAENLSTITIKLYRTTYDLLTAEEISQIEARGYTLERT